MDTEDLAEDIELEFEFSLKPSTDPAFSHCLLDFNGKAIMWDDENGEEVTVGEISGHRLDLAVARASKVDFQDFLGSVSDQVSDLGKLVFDGGTCMLNADTAEGIESRECDCLVYVEELLVDPAHRGQFIGTFLMRRMSESIDMENGLVALKAHPITGEGVASAGKSYTAEEIAKVKHFYERLGFNHTIGDFMIKDARLCAAQKSRRKARMT